MATKETAAKTETKTEEKIVDEWQDMREIVLPRGGSHEPKTLYVSINGRSFSVPRNGKPQTVPYPVYERLQIMLAAEALVEDYIEAMPRAEAPGK